MSIGSRLLLSTILAISCAAGFASSTHSIGMVTLRGSATRVAELSINGGVNSKVATDVLTWDKSSPLSEKRSHIQVRTNMSRWTLDARAAGPDNQSLDTQSLAQITLWCQPASEPIRAVLTAPITFSDLRNFTPIAVASGPTFKGADVYIHYSCEPSAFRERTVTAIVQYTLTDAP